MTQDNGIVQCPAEDCTKVFDNRERFTKHVTNEHPPEEVIDTDGPQVPTK